MLTPLLAFPTYTVTDIDQLTWMVLEPTCPKGDTPHYKHPSSTASMVQWREKQPISLGKVKEKKRKEQAQQPPQLHERSHTPNSGKEKKKKKEHTYTADEWLTMLTTAIRSKSNLKHAGRLYYYTQTTFLEFPVNCIFAWGYGWIFMKLFAQYKSPQAR